jgi:hypothetical protein
MSPLAVLAALADRLGDCPRRPGPCDCFICAADQAIEKAFRPLIRAACNAVNDEYRRQT